LGTVLCDGQKHPENHLLTKLADYICQLQNVDGGWVDVEETAWAIAFLKKMTVSYQPSVEKGLKWLDQQRTSYGCWGRNSRDKPRIPYTSWVIVLIPELASIEDLKWLELECGREINTDPLLSYKIALPLIAFDRCKYSLSNEELISALVSFLVKSQNDDGGFAPWRGHPCGSDPWCTAVAVLGLLTNLESIPGLVLAGAFNWFESNQLPDGIWPYHYIDEGTALAYWALKDLTAYYEGKN
jgi:prenyltransferase beta subunit